jgi:hypothetical protein
MYSGTISFGVGIDPQSLPAHLASCLRRVEARRVTIEDNRVTFRAGVFRLVGSWNALVAFGFGDLTVDSSARQVRYRLSFRQLVVIATLLVGLMAASILHTLPSHQSLWFVPFAWASLVGMNLAIGIPRFETFIRQSISTAPTIAQTHHPT